MQGINTVVLVGRLAADPILRKTQSNKSVTSFTVAVDRRTGQGNEQTADFINCTTWNQVADNVAKYLRKGSLVALEGRLQQNKFTDKQGNNRSSYEVVCDNVRFLDTKSSQTSNTEPSSNYESNLSYEPDPVYPDEDLSDIEGLDIPTDDLPF